MPASHPPKAGPAAEPAAPGIFIPVTNAIESPNARFRQATRRRGHFPNELCALKVLYLVIRNPDANRTNVTGHTTGGKAALNHGGRTSGSVGQAAGHRWA